MQGGNDAEHGAAAQEEASERWEPGAWTDDLQAAGCAPASTRIKIAAAVARQPPRPSELVDRIAGMTPMQTKRMKQTQAGPGGNQTDDNPGHLEPRMTASFCLCIRSSDSYIAIRSSAS